MEKDQYNIRLKGLDVNCSLIEKTTIFTHSFDTCAVLRLTIKQMLCARFFFFFFLLLQRTHRLGRRMQYTYVLSTLQMSSPMSKCQMHAPNINHRRQVPVCVCYISVNTHDDFKYALLNSNHRQLWLYK